MSYFLAGKTLKKGQYKIIERLGFGGFGVTYLAEDFKRKTQVAIKTINVMTLEQRYKDKHGNLDGFSAYLTEEQDKFNSEAMVLASFEHPHIVKIYPELFQDDGISCMVMEYIKGKNLVQCVQNNGLFSEVEGLKIIEQVGNALTYVHSKNHLHRDVKPQNILLRDSDKQAVLIDFGLAREVDFSASMSLTNAATPPFAPPE